ncbi:hypothetical protein IFM47457_08214 [Aspergillus lentulus]|nr:hypothetical protein IFM47457_08214 [Aspergillus lentulus]
MAALFYITFYQRLKSGITYETLYPSPKAESEFCCLWVPGRWDRVYGVSLAFTFILKAYLPSWY